MNGSLLSFNHKIVNLLMIIDDLNLIFLQLAIIDEISVFGKIKFQNR